MLQETTNLNEEGKEPALLPLVPIEDESDPLPDMDTAEPSNSDERSRWKFSWWMVPLVGVLLAFGGLSVYRLQNKSGEEVAVTERSPLTVRTVAAEEGDIQAWVSSEGTVQAVRFKHLAFDVDGDITYLMDRDGRSLRAGDSVSQGELLASIDDRTLQADVIQAESAVNEARRQRGAAAASVAQAEAQVASARAQVAQAEAGRAPGGICSRVSADRTTALSTAF